MFIFIGLAIIGAIIGGVLAANNDYYDKGFLVISAVMGIMFSLVISFPLSLVIGAIPGGVVETRQELVALKDNITTEGSFFLGSGRVEGEMYYFYMAKESDGGFTAHKVYADDHCRVYEDSGTPYVKFTYHRSFAEPWLVINI